MFLCIDGTLDVRCRLLLNSQHNYREGGSSPDLSRYRKSENPQSCLLLNNQWRVVVENQPPVPLLLYPYSGEAVVTGDSFAFVLPIHCGDASLDSRVSVGAHLNLVGGDKLKFQFTGRKI